MASIKTNISPQSKDRLRQAILDEIGAKADSGGAPPAFSTANDDAIKPATARPSAKVLRKIGLRSDAAIENGPARGEEVKSKAKDIGAAAIIKIAADSVEPEIKKASKKVKTKHMPANEKDKKKVVKKPKSGSKAKTAVKNPKVSAFAAIKSGDSKGKRQEYPIMKTNRSAVSSARSLNTETVPTAKKIFKPRPFAPIYEAEDVNAAPPATIAPRFGLYRPGKKAAAVAAKDESLEKIFQTSSKVKKAQKAALDMIGAEPKGKKKFSWLKVAAWLGVVLAIVLAVDVAGLYALGFDDPASYQVAKILHLPAGTVNGRVIGLAEYLDAQDTLSAALLKQREGVIDYSGKADVKDRVFYYLATQRLVEEKLAEYKKNVSDREIDNQAGLLLQQTGGQAGAEKIVKNLYDMPMSGFKRDVLRPMMEREALLAAIMNDPSVALNTEAEKKASDVLRMALSSSTDFEALAKQYTDDESSINTGGDLGWVGKGQLDASWEPLIFSAATGTVVSTTVKSAYGYHVIKIEQRVTDKATNSTNVKLRHILIKVDIDRYIKNLLSESAVNQFVK